MPLLTPIKDSIEAYSYAISTAASGNKDSQKFLLFMLNYIATFPIRIPYETVQNIKTTTQQDSFQGRWKAAALDSDGKIGTLDLFVRSNIPAALNNAFNDIGVKVQWLFQAKKADLVKVLYDPSYQHIVTIGHGNTDVWKTYDGEITTEEIQQLYRGRKRKRGYWFQFSCGGEMELPLGYYVMENPRRNCLFFDKVVSVYHMRFSGIPKHCLDSMEGS